MDPNLNQPVTNQEPETSVNSSLIEAPADEILVQEITTPVVATTETTTTETQIKNPLSTLIINEAPEPTPVQPTQEQAQPVPPTPQPATQAEEIIETPSEIVEDITSDNETKPKETNHTLTYVLVGVALVLLGIFIGVTASNLIPQNSQTPVAQPKVTPTEIISPTIEITPEASPSPTLSSVEQSLINKYIRKYYSALAITPDLIQRCNYKGSVVYSISQRIVPVSPSFVVDSKGVFLMNCGVSASKTSNCSLVSMCQQIDIPSPTKSYTCPPSEFVDCQPGVGAEKKECSQDYLSWAKANCAGFRGAAL